MSDTDVLEHGQEHDAVTRVERRRQVRGEDGYGLLLVPHSIDLVVYDRLCRGCAVKFTSSMVVAGNYSIFFKEFIQVVFNHLFNYFLYRV